MISQEFSFCVFQPNPQAERVLYWLDGDPNKKSTSMGSFIETIRERGIDSFYGMIDALRTYSFYLISIPDKKVTKLEGASGDISYKDNVVDSIHGKPSAQQVKEKKVKTVEETLMEYGFGPVDPTAIKNLKVSLTKTPPQERGLFSRFFYRGH